MGYQDCVFYSRAVFIDFGINICASYNRGRLVFEEIQYIQ